MSKYVRTARDDIIAPRAEKPTGQSVNSLYAPSSIDEPSWFTVFSDHGFTLFVANGLVWISSSYPNITSPRVLKPSKQASHGPRLITRATLTREEDALGGAWLEITGGLRRAFDSLTITISGCSCTSALQDPDISR